MRTTVKRIHFVGIGGVGMSGIAEMLLRLGEYQVSGSDIANSRLIQHLQSLGAEIQFHHQVDLVCQADVLVYSSAIKDDNPELLEARKNRIPIISRAAMLAELMRFKHGIAVAGTHGKTTTTSLLATALIEAKLDPTYVVGGVMNASNRNVNVGKGNWMVVEADESDASFLHLQPLLSIITNVDLDHMQTYADDTQKLHQTFIEFIHNLPFYGTCIACWDDHGVQQILPRLSRRVLTYGFSEGADYQLFNYRQQGFQGMFKIRHYQHNEQHELGEFMINMPGKHNALNAAATLVLAADLDIDMDAVQHALANFSGVNRRFSIHHPCRLGKVSLTWLNDYAHHPTEIKATAEALQAGWQKMPTDRRRILVFQPHRYSRTHDLFDDFIRVLSEIDMDLLILTEVYAASETPIPSATSEALAQALRLRGQTQVMVLADQQQLAENLPNLVNENDWLISMGAGSISNWMNDLLTIEPN